MTLVIAEAGVNHNGSEELALELVEIAHQAGADIVKFQTFKASKLVTKSARQAEYQIQNTGQEESQYAMLKRLELSADAYHRLQQRCVQLGIEFLSTAFDSESLSFLVNELKLTTLKIPSGELTNLPLVLEHARTGCNLIVSTGMATLADIEHALGAIAFGLTADEDEAPSLMKFSQAYASNKGKSALRNKVTLLHCTTEYPAPLDEINLKAMCSMANTFGLPAGYSDHSAGITVPIAAAALGAKVIEKHFTIDKTMAGPDHKASLDPNELKSMVTGIRDVDKALGDGLKAPTVSEVKNKAVARKSLVASCDIEAGDSFSTKNIGVRRPGNGMSPSQYWQLLGTAASKSYREGDLIDE